MIRIRFPRTDHFLLTDLIVISSPKRFRTIFLASTCERAGTSFTVCSSSRSIVTMKHLVPHLISVIPFPEYIIIPAVNIDRFEQFPALLHVVVIP